MNEDGFANLRLNSGTNEVSEGFWPSFTDIMTVIVMIFLIAMVVLLLRNLELVNQLRATMEAERIAAELARATGEEKDSLSVALHAAEEREQKMQLQLMRLQDQTLDQESKIAQQLRDITGLTDQRDDLARQAAQLETLRQRLESDVAARQTKLTEALQKIDDKDLQLNTAQRTIASLEEGLSTLQQRYQESQQTTERLETQVSEQQRHLEAARAASEDVERRYLVLADEFDQLKVKYDKLVRPARSSAGRYLIEVRYWKQDGEYRIEWREGDQGGFQMITRSQLDKVLTRIAQQHEEGLYVKVIFPENSGLSYNEAWEFTSHLHSNFDYYFKSNPEDEQPVTPSQQSARGG